MPQTLPTGTILNGRFKIRRLLSESPIGSAYLVDDVKITEKPWVAREYLPLPVATSERLAVEESFHKTVEFLKTLNHPNLVRVMDSFMEGNRTYLITEFVDGLSMDAISSLTSNPLPEKQVMEWALQICGTLEYLHNLPTPFYANDLNPRYLIVDRDGRVKVGGFGLDLIFASAHKIPSPCAAPEVARDQKGSIAGDIYTLCACLYVLLARKTPKPPIDPLKDLNGQVSDATNRVVMQCLDQDPAARVGSLAELQDRFLKILNPPPAPPVRRSRVAVGALWQRAAMKVSDGLAVVIGAGIELYRRPHFIVLAALVIAALWFTVKPFSPQPFQKIGPLAYVLSSKKAFVVNPETLKAVGTIAGIDPTFAAYSPHNREVWLASDDGQVLVVDTQTNAIVNKVNLMQPIGGFAIGGGGNVYFSMDRDNTLNAISPSGLPASETPVGRDPGDVVYDSSNNSIYVANLKSNSISVVDSREYLVKNTISLDGSPSHIAITSDGNFLLVVYNDLQRLDVFSTGSNSRVTSIPMTAAGPYALSVSSAEVAVAAHDGDQIFIYQISTWTKLAEVPLDKPESVAFSSDEARIFACNDDGYFSIIDSSGTGQPLSQYLGKSLMDILSVP